MKEHKQYDRNPTTHFPPFHQKSHHFVMNWQKPFRNGSSSVPQPRVEEVHGTVSTAFWLLHVNGAQKQERDC